MLLRIKCPNCAEPPPNPPFPGKCCGGMAFWEGSIIFPQSLICWMPILHILHRGEKVEAGTVCTVLDNITFTFSLPYFLSFFRCGWRSRDYYLNYSDFFLPTCLCLSGYAEHWSIFSERTLTSRWPDWWSSGITGSVDSFSPPMISTFSLFADQTSGYEPSQKRFTGRRRPSRTQALKDGFYFQYRPSRAFTIVSPDRRKTSQFSGIYNACQLDFTPIVKRFIYEITSCLYFCTFPLG